MMNTGLRRFGIETDQKLDENMLLEALTGRIEDMLMYETDLLFSTLYRLDVRERDIKRVLDGAKDEPIAAGLARLVVERQKEKNKSKADHRQAQPGSNIDDVEFNTD